MAGPRGGNPVAVAGNLPPDAYEFGVMADLPYTEENERMLPALLEDMNQAEANRIDHSRVETGGFATRNGVFDLATGALITG